ncbi:putative bifunctional diguanylate cyclase/phosphodiesterase [Magnetovibrio sp.]|uniref:putative bifunctional diguanylate cyclase/phosphodiesterase n=1 Tax=Magnetovibrio sp. TaxID=2024836 RepID=UPI002F91E409
MDERTTDNQAPRILVVDDNAMNRDLLVRRLARQGFAMDTASGGLEALEKVAKNSYDLVLLDINMPDLDGISVLSQVRETKDQSELPIIMVSARDASDSIAEAINKGANDYITKPVDFPVAQARIRTQLDVLQTHKKLKESEERYALAFRGANDGLWDWDIQNGRVYFSQRWKDMLGYGQEEFGNQPDDWFNLVHPEEVERLKLAVENHLLGQSDALEHEYRALHKDGTFRWLLTRGVASRGADGQAVRLSGSQTDVTRTKAYDPITSIPNKFLFMDRLEWLLDKERRKRRGRYAVLLIHIDRLDELRQTLGPVAGEEIIINAAYRLIDSLRVEDSVSRLFEAEATTVSRHDEADFAVLAEGCRDESTAPKIAERLRQAITKPMEVAGENLVLTASMGIVAGAMEEGLDATEVIAHAASALSRARRKGPGNYELFDKHMQQRAIARLKMETDLRRAVADGQLALHYQPIVKLDSGEIAGCEALARWRHPERGNIPPAEFIPLAEETGLIDLIGDWVLEEACTQHQKWSDGRADKVDLSVNFSLLQMQRDGVEDRVMDILNKTGMDPRRLKIEITESIFMEDMDRIKGILSALNDEGIGIAIDDYGTGYSSLSYLKRLPITHLKIDRSFIGDVSSDIAAQAIVQSTLLMAQSLGIEVVAEGIETIDQEALLKVLKAEYGQGYHFWRPISGDDFAALLTRPAHP